LVEELVLAIAAYEADPAGGLLRFAAAVERFATAEMEHMALEVKVILPAAGKYLSEEDWKEIGIAFAGNSDPRFSADNDEEFRTLFARIMNLAPVSMIGNAHGE
jgi:hemerythrin-like domain-containing protein